VTKSNVVCARQGAPLDQTHPDGPQADLRCVPVSGQAFGMSLIKTLLGGGLALALGVTAVAADPLMRPFSRDDARAAEQASAVARLAAFRAEARPAYMIRYPARVETRAPEMRPMARAGFLPRTRWAHKEGSDLWTRAAMTAISGHGDGLESLVPRDIDRWCPAYRDSGPEGRRAFWVGMMSALAKHESTYNPRAVGGGDLWYGLLQIYPDTIAVHDGRWRGVAADWGPMSNRSKIAEMAAWTSQQAYCQPAVNTRPVARPPLQVVSTAPLTDGE